MTSPRGTAARVKNGPVPDAAEVPLVGGTANRGAVVRVEKTVHRPLRPTSPATHALLRHLEAVGFEGAPRFLEVDRQGREVLSFVPGRAVYPPYPPWALTDDALRSVGRLLRAYHAAVASFDPALHAWPQSPPPGYAGGPVSHNDPNLDNVVFREGRAVALIDFDLASPGSTLWDVAAAARLWAPLRPNRLITDARRGRALRRLRVFLDAYGVDADTRGGIADAVLANHDWCYDIVRGGAEGGHEAFAEHWNGGAAQRAERTRAWYVESRDVLLRAVS